ncbi:MAG: hypothetical protein P8Z36_14220 [Gemmatimonadota bacterium]
MRILHAGSFPAALLALSLMLPAALVGQSLPMPPDSTVAPGNCPLEMCGLRIRQSRILRGFGGETVGRLGAFGNVDILLHGPDDAARDARLHKILTGNAMLAWVTSTPLLILGPVAAADGPAEHYDSEIITMAVSWTLGLYLLNRAIVLDKSGRRAADRAVWSYNVQFAPDAASATFTRPIRPTSDPSAWLILGGGTLGAVAGSLDSRESFYWGTLAGAGVGALLSALTVHW